MSLEEHAKQLQKEKLEDNSGKYIYPLTIIKDRYSGTYSGGKYTAWNKESWDIPTDISSSDTVCSSFWGYNEQDKEHIVGLGSTPDKALKDLCLKLKKNGSYKPI